MYILVAYHYESNNIHAEPLKNIRPGFKASLTETPHPIDQKRVETSPTYTGQLMSQCAQNFHEGGK